MNSNTRKFIIGIILLICFAYTSKYEKMKEAKFDKYAIENLDKYKNLCQFIEKNLDELIAHRNSKNYVTHSGRDTTYRKLRYDTCYTFVRRSHESDFPDKLETEFYSLVDSIEKKNLLAFDMCLNSKIEITLKYDYVGFSDGWQWKQCHKLEYKPRRDLRRRCDYEILQDTILNADFGYYIYLYYS